MMSNVQHSICLSRKYEKTECQCFTADVKLQLHDAIYRLQFYSNSLIHILSFSNSHNKVASIQKNRSDKSHRFRALFNCSFMQTSLQLVFSITL